MVMTVKKRSLTPSQYTNYTNIGGHNLLHCWWKVTQCTQHRQALRLSSLEVSQDKYVTTSTHFLSLVAWDPFLHVVLLTRVLDTGSKFLKKLWNLINGIYQCPLPFPAVLICSKTWRIITFNKTVCSSPPVSNLTKSLQGYSERTCAIQKI